MARTRTRGFTLIELMIVLVVIAVLAAIAYSAVASYVLLKLVGLVMPLKVAKKEEGLGLDVSQHGEEAYGSGEGAILVLPGTKLEAALHLEAAGPVPEGGRV